MLFDGQLCGRLKAFESAGTEWRSELGIESGGGGSAVTLGYCLDAMALAGADALCVLEPDIEFVGRMPMDVSR